MKVYVVTMHRWGDSESHNYVQGVFTKKFQAEKAGKAENLYRGGKYEYKISECTLNEHDSDSISYFQRVEAFGQ